MMEQGNLPTQRVNISTQKMLGGIGSISILLVFVPGTVATLLGIVGVVLWLISMYQLSNILRKPSIFKKVLIGFILNIVGTVIAFAFGLTAGISLSAYVRGETGITSGLGLLAVAIIVAYAISLAAFYFYKEAFDILAQATVHNLFKIAGLLMFIGAITTILFGLGILLIIVGYIVLAVAFFTAPNEVEVQST